MVDATFGKPMPPYKARLLSEKAPIDVAFLIEKSINHISFEFNEDWCLGRNRP